MEICVYDQTFSSATKSHWFLSMMASFSLIGNPPDNHWFGLCAFLPSIFWDPWVYGKQTCLNVDSKLCFSWIPKFFLMIFVRNETQKFQMALQLWHTFLFFFHWQLGIFTSIWQPLPEKCSMLVAFTLSPQPPPCLLMVTSLPFYNFSNSCTIWLKSLLHCSLVIAIWVKILVNCFWSHLSLCSPNLFELKF